MSKVPGQSRAEFAIRVSDAWQHRGLGSELLRRLVQIGRDERLSQITADILPDDLDMRRRPILDGRGVKEERRPCYVDVTRAQDTLVLSFCRQRMKWGKPRASIPSSLIGNTR